VYAFAFGNAVAFFRNFLMQQAVADLRRSRRWCGKRVEIDRIAATVV